MGASNTPENLTARYAKRPTSTNLISIDRLVVIRERRDRGAARMLTVGLDGATVSEVACRHDLMRQQIYAWRHELKKKGLLPPTADTVFLPVDMPVIRGAALAREEAEPASAMIELRLNHGRSLCFDSGVDGTVLTHLIRAVEAA